MDEKIYKVTLADGTVIDNLRLNGNNYISEKELSADMFLGNLGTVTINDGEKDTVYENMSLVQLAKYDDEYWFILRTMTKKELQEIKNRSDIDYIAMMTDIEL